MTQQCYKNLKSRFVEVAILSDSTSIRFVLMMAEFIWAISLWWPGDTFERQVYTGMAGFFREEIWGAMFFVTACIQGLYIVSGRYNNTPSFIFATWSVLLWWFVVISMYISAYPPPAGISGELALAIAASWVLCKTGTHNKDYHARRHTS